MLPQAKECSNQLELEEQGGNSLLLTNWDSVVGFPIYSQTIKT